MVHEQWISYGSGEIHEGDTITLHRGGGMPHNMCVVCGGIMGVEPRVCNTCGSEYRHVMGGYKIVKVGKSMAELLFYTLHGKQVVTDEKGAYVKDVTRRVKTADFAVALGKAHNMAEETGFHVQVVNRVLNIDKTVSPEYLKNTHTPD